MPDHRCAADNRCKDSYLVGAVRFGAVIADQRGVCRRCHGNIARALDSIQSDWDKLSAAVGDQGSGGRERVSGTPGSPMPLNGAVLALRSSLSEWCEAALWAVAESLGIDVKARHKARGWPVKELPVITQAARTLPDNLDKLLKSERQTVAVWRAPGFGSCWDAVDMDGIDIALKLANLHSETNSVLGQTNPRKRLSMPCPILDCGAKGTLGIDNGATDVTCTACGGRWTQREYDWLANLLVSEHQREEIHVLKWLLAEAKWKLDEAQHIIDAIRRVTRLTEADLVGIDGYAVIELLRETVEPQPVSAAEKIAS